MRTQKITTRLGLGSNSGLIILFIFLYLALAPAAGAAAGVPKILNYQGRLLDSSQNLLGGAGTDFCFKFSIYDDATVGAPDNKLWPSATSSVMTINVSKGVFNTALGDTSAGSDVLDFNFQDNDTIFLNIEVADKVGPTCSSGDGAEVFETLGPRQRIVASGYALNADTVDGFHAAQFASSTQIPVLTSGNLILGGVNPQLNATSTNTLTLQGGSGTGDIQFFSGANRITSAGALTVAGAIGGSIINLSGSSNQIVFQSGGITGTLSWTPTTTNKIITIPDISDTLVTLTANQNLTNKTLTSSTIQGVVSAGTGLTMPVFTLGGAILGNAQNITDLNQLTVTGLTVTSTFSTGGLSVGTNQFVIQQTSGNVGIGTASPSERMQLVGGNFLQDQPTSPKVIGGAALSLPGGGSQLSYTSGRYVYAIFDNAAGTSILRIIDATDPTSPVVVGGSALSLPGSPRSIYVAGRYAYILFRNAIATDIFRIVDISNRANPTVVGGAALSLPANGQHIFVSGRYAYTTFDNGAGANTFRIIDVANPANPSVVGGSTLSLPTSPRQIYVAGRYAYVAFYSVVNTDAFRVIDVADPKNPAVAGGSSLVLGFSAWSIYVSGRYAYVGFANSTGGQIFRVVDISNPAAPSIAGGSALDSVLPGFAKSIYVAGRYAYVTFDNAASTSTFRIIDVSSPANPSVVGGASLALPGFSRSVFVNGHYAYLVFFQGAGTDVFRIVDISGVEAVSALIHSLEAGSLQVSANAQIQNQLAVGGGINIDGGGLFASGGIGINGESLFTPLFDSMTTFRVQNAAGSETLFTADATNNRFKIGDDDPAANPTTLLVLDTKADAGDPAGTNGATYYNSNTQKFRCFENSAWKDCDTAGSGGSSFKNFTLLADAVGVTMTNAVTAPGTEITNLVSRRKIDFTGMTNCRGQFASSLTSATVNLNLQYSLDGSAWSDLCPDAAATTTANGLSTGIFGAIAAGAKTDVFVRAMIIGNGVLDPIIRHASVDAN